MPSTTIDHGSSPPEASRLTCYPFLSFLSRISQQTFGAIVIGPLILPAYDFTSGTLFCSGRESRLTNVLLVFSPAFSFASLPNSVSSALKVNQQGTNLNFNPKRPIRLDTEWSPPRGVLR